MATREEMIAFLQNKAPAAATTREQKIAFLQSKTAQKPEEPGIGETALESFGKGATLGYLPQLQAMAEPITDRIFSAVTGKPLDAAPMEQALAQGPAYVKARDENIRRQAEQTKANPKTAMAGNVAGMLASGIATGGIMPEAGAATTIGGKIAQGTLQGARTGIIYGALANPGDTTGVVDPLQAKLRVENAGKGAAFGGVVGGAAPLVGPAVRAGSKAVQGAASKVQDVAEKMAVNATGATGKQASKFADNAGRELLDRGIVRFGDSQSKIAERASAAVENANKQIDDSLKALEAKGINIDTDEIKRRLSEKIAKLNSDPSQADVANLLEKEIGHIDDAVEANHSTGIGIQAAEQTKRGYNRKAGNWADPEKGAAGKTMYQVYRGAVEDAANAADPKIAGAFEEGKKTYGLLAPIQEAAERRAATTQQHPAGGFLDMTSAVAGAAKAGPLGAVGAPVARRLIAPRLASSTAVTLDSAANLLRKIPEFANLEVTKPQAFEALVSHLTDSKDAASGVLKAADVPSKGPDKWANDGIQKLQDHVDDPAVKDQIEKAKGALLAAPGTKKLLISASDLKPGSKAMAAVMAKIQDKLEGAR